MWCEVAFDVMHLLDAVCCDWRETGAAAVGAVNSMTSVWCEFVYHLDGRTYWSEGRGCQTDRRAFLSVLIGERIVYLYVAYTPRCVIHVVIRILVSVPIPQITFSVAKGTHIPALNFCTLRWISDMFLLEYKQPYMTIFCSTGQYLQSIMLFLILLSYLSANVYPWFWCFVSLSFNNSWKISQSQENMYFQNYQHIAGRASYKIKTAHALKHARINRNTQLLQTSHHFPCEEETIYTLYMDMDHPHSS